ncbi:MAG: vitamin B12-dependent ribonucleotide reductase [Phycisphaerae bacterium]|nr:vitamin B12-dependent ribonucleotide reductase [Phycisphaerae bacterium]
MITAVKKDDARLSRFGTDAAGCALTENAIRVLEARYLAKDENGRCIESPEDLFRRVARCIADVERQYGADEAEREHWEEMFFQLMWSGRFMPNSPTLMNAGREMGMLSACFVLPVPDSIDGIFDSIKHTALIQKAGGGTGFAFDELRPTGDFIRSSGGTTSGPISFWRAFSEATNAIQQGAFRRGANMGMMYIHHPDILKFLHAKEDLSQFTNYNISVKVTDDWMDSFLRDPDGPHIVLNPRTQRRYYLPRNLKTWEYDIRSLIPTEETADRTNLTSSEARSAVSSVRLKSDGRMVEVYTRRDIWNIIIQNAWRTGEPGVVFIDRINEVNPTPHVGRIEATNPCGEQPLLPYEACNLGSVNVGAFVRNECTPQAEIDWSGLREAVHQSTRFLDNVIDANRYPLPQIDAVCKGNRKIGIGIMGFADMLYRLNVRYNSDEGVAWGERIMRFVNDEAHACSEGLARERGCFPNWTGSRWDTEQHRPMRNAAVTTVAPTGTISILANCSGGIEPMFSLVFLRNVLKGQEQGKKPLLEVNETFLEAARQRGFYSEGLMERCATEGTLAHIPEIPADVRHVFVCAHDIEPEWHVRMQAAFQRHCDASISKTINFPHSATAEDVETIYRMAYDLDCKGVTVYRDGCRSCQPMALKSSEDKHGRSPSDGGNGAAASSNGPSAQSAPGVEPIRTDRPGPPVRPADGAPPVKAVTERNLFGEKITTVQRSQAALEPRDLPWMLAGLRIRQPTPFGNMHVKITVEPHTEKEMEVFAQLGKGGDLATSDLEAICRMVSLWLRAGGSLSHVIKQLSDIGSSLQIATRTGRIRSLGDGLAEALKRYQRAKERHGLKALLLGEVDPAELDREYVDRGNGKRHGPNGGSTRAAESGDVTMAAARGGEGSADLPTPGASFAATIESRQGFKLKCPEPNCDGFLYVAEGCMKCLECGFAAC